GLDITFTEGALGKLVREYTREAGVRNLEREVASILRKLAVDIVDSVGKRSKTAVGGDMRLSRTFQSIAKKKRWVIDEKSVEGFLRAPKFKVKPEELSNKIGVAMGLAWTSMGGDTLPVEVTIMPGAERLTLTGKLGEVMKESAMAALSYLRSNHVRYGLEEMFAKDRQIHIHVPEGAIPKDGPSAGITMTMALLSAATGRELRGDVAMTGEVTLRGNVLAIGGLNEKLLAARRAGMTTVLVPAENRKDVDELQAEVTRGLKIVFVSHADEAVKVAFVDPPKPPKSARPTLRSPHSAAN
ncbi:MAG: Lon protease 1, partial [Bacteroidota bacterium]